MKDFTKVILGLAFLVVFVLLMVVLTGAPIDPDVQRVPVQFYIESGGKIVGAVWLGDAFGALYADVHQFGPSLQFDNLTQFPQPDRKK